jgi:peptide/nickel transport system permease protein
MSSATRKANQSPVIRIFRYLSKRILSIALTIIVGIFGTVILVNATGQLDRAIRDQATDLVTRMMWSGGWSSTDEEDFQETRARLIEEQLQAGGYYLPFLQKHLFYTRRAMTFDWGQMLGHNPALTAGVGSTEIRDIILTRLPNTLLLMGTAYLLLFLTGIPLALSLSRKNDSFFDRLFTFLSPISSIPSWVHGVLLILLVGIAVQWLPISGMYDHKPPETQLGYIEVVLRHMILPVTAILLSLYFQLVYSWRTYFLLFADEEYVDLAVAKGLDNRSLHRKYILRPGMPYVITSFAMTLVSFWQTTTALEVVFQWPGIGYTYIKSLPHFFGESMYSGELAVAIGIVVIFAYLLGAMVLLLDILYLIVDPRIRLENKQKMSSPIRHWRSIKRQLVKPTKSSSDIRYQWRVIRQTIKRFIKELRRYPSAMIGISILFLFIIGSMYAIIFYPYATAGAAWNSSSFIEKSYDPRTANPVWVNFFRKNDLPESIHLDSNMPEVIRTDYISGENPGKTFTFTFEYPYGGDIPQDILFFYDPKIERKNPFSTITWVKPDGTQIDFSGNAVRKTITYDLREKISARKLLSVNPNWKEWYIIDGVEATSPFWLLFAQPESTTPAIQTGTYQIIVDVLMFEPDADIDIEVKIVGQVYGLAGTDYMRRDLMFPLLWGMPFVILLGLIGAVSTTTLAMFVAAISVWYNGWVDTLIQRLTEANMILPVLAISILVHVIFQVDMMIVIGIVIIMNVFSSPTKIFRSAFLQIKDAPYIEAARVYGASNSQLIFRYMIPRIIPILIPQLVILIPSYVFLEATFGLFNIRSLYPTWGRVIYEALNNGAMYGSKFWVLEPLFLLLLTGFAFTLLGSALDRVLNPKLNKG